MEFEPTRNLSIRMLTRIQSHLHHPLKCVSKFSLPGFGQMSERIGELCEDETEIGFPGQQERTPLSTQSFYSKMRSESLSFEIRKGFAKRYISYYIVDSVYIQPFVHIHTYTV